MLVDLDCFFVSVERVRDPSLNGRVVVVGGDPNAAAGRSGTRGGRRGVISCASYEARRYGVRAGMPLVQAVRQLPRDAVYLRGSFKAYQEASHQVMETLRRFTPSVEPLSLDEALLDMTGCARMHQLGQATAGWLQIAEDIRNAVREATGLTISIGIAGSRTTAKVACELAKPGGLLEVRRGEEGAFLASLPLRRLPGIGPRTLERLERFHLSTIGDFAILPDDIVHATFGKVGEALLRRARGQDAAGRGPVRPAVARSISRETTFSEDSDDRDMVEGMLSYLAQRALRALRSEGLLARRVSVKLRYSDFQTVQVQRSLRRPCDHDDTILNLVRRLARQRWDRRVKLRLVGVALGDLTPVGDRQLDLFEDELLAVSWPTATPREPAEAVGTSAVASRALVPQSAEGIGADTPRIASASARRIGGQRRSQRTCELQHLTGRTGAANSRLDRAIDVLRERHGFGAVVRGRAIDLLPRVSSSNQGFRLQTPANSA